MGDGNANLQGLLHLQCSMFNNELRKTTKIHVLGIFVMWQILFITYAEEVLLLKLINYYIFLHYFQLVNGITRHLRVTLCILVCMHYLRRVWHYGNDCNYFGGHGQKVGNL